MSDKNKVQQIDADGNVIQTYASITDAAKAMGVSLSTMSLAITKKHRCKGYKFRKILESKRREKLDLDIQKVYCIAARISLQKLQAGFSRWTCSELREFIIDFVLEQSKNFRGGTTGGYIYNLTKFAELRFFGKLATSRREFYLQTDDDDTRYLVPHKKTESIQHCLERMPPDIRQLAEMELDKLGKIEIYRAVGGRIEYKRLRQKLYRWLKDGANRAV